MELEKSPVDIEARKAALMTAPAPSTEKKSRRRRFRKVVVDESQFVVHRNDPLIDAEHVSRIPFDLTIDELEVGDSMEFPVEFVQAIRSAAMFRQDVLGKRFTFRFPREYDQAGKRKKIAKCWRIE